MRLGELDYQLPPELIARHPAATRDSARLLVVNDEGLAHRRFAELPELLPGALFIVNDTRVIRARLFGKKVPSGGRVELLLVRRLDQEGARWTAMARASRGLRPGSSIRLADGFEALVESGVDAEGLYTVKLHTTEPVDALLERLGHVPLPPYIDRPDEPADRERYQTIYARVPGAVAAPTAGLHFSRELYARCDVASITLHVGPGTFRPVSVPDLDDHPMHAECFEVPAETCSRIARAREEGAPIVAVGTTVVRALESAVVGGALAPMRGETRLLIQPGYCFRVIDALVTNFHLPGSTLLALVYAFGGVDRMRAAYREAIERLYRFYSYGDAMLILRGRA